MGKYINYNSKKKLLNGSYLNKLNTLKKDGAIVIPRPEKFVNNLILIGNNGPWGFAAYMYSKEEFHAYKDDLNGREHTWLLYEHAKNVAR
tara:strand:+ start:442 stop:711 length:270 start_codon:yes stop_codon:yes gene_type:complete